MQGERRTDVRQPATGGLRWVRVPVFTCSILLACAPLNPNSTTLGPASVVPGSVSARAVGCWELDWRLRGQDTGVAEGELPDSVELGDSPIFVSQGWALTPATHPAGRGLGPGISADSTTTWEARFRANRWNVVGETIEVVFSEEAAFWLLSLSSDEGGLRGAGSYYEREGPDDALLEATVAARRFPCRSWVGGGVDAPVGAR